MNMVTLSWIVHTKITPSGIPATHHKPKPPRSHHAKSSSRHHHEDRDRQHQSRSQSHFCRHCSSSHCNSYRSCSRSQHRDKCSHHRSSSWCSCSTYRGYSHQSCHNTPHQRSSIQNFFNLPLQRQQQIMLMTTPPILEARLAQIKFTFQWIMRQTTPQEEPEDENRRSTHILLQLWWTLQWLRRGIWSFKLTEPSPSSDSHQQGGLPTCDLVTVALIMDCPTITVHAGKHYKAHIDSGAAISIIRYSTYQLLDDSFKTPIQPTTTKLNMADGSPMMALGMTAFHLKTVDFKFTYNFIICNRLPDTWNNIWDWYTEVFTIICLG